MGVLPLDLKIRIRGAGGADVRYLWGIALPFKG
jgi:hypothetical protein